MGCQGYSIQLDFIKLVAPEHFYDNLDLIFVAIDSILVMFEESLVQQQHQNREALSALSQTQMNTSAIQQA